MAGAGAGASLGAGGTRASSAARIETGSGASKPGSTTAPTSPLAATRALGRLTVSAALAPLTCSASRLSAGSGMPLGSGSRKAPVASVRTVTIGAVNLSVAGLNSICSGPAGEPSGWWSMPTSSGGASGSASVVSTLVRLVWTSCIPR